MSDTYNLDMPLSADSAVVFSSPHSGSRYPADFLRESSLDMNTLRSSEDAFVNELFASAPDHGSPLLSSNVPRAFVDLNRSKDDIDPAVVKGAVKKPDNPLVVAGLGVIPRVVAKGKVIRRGKIPMPEALERLRQYYFPYHNCLKKLLTEQQRRHGIVVLLDCHSMPEEALVSAPLINGEKPDVVIGDRFGSSCDRWITEAVSEVFTSAGMLVAKNAPFSGGFITRNYGRPSRGFHALQIEICRTAYMHEASIEKRENFAEIRQVFSSITAQLTTIAQNPLHLAAE